jgi:H+-transporting ATPase
MKPTKRKSQNPIKAESGDAGDGYNVDVENGSAHVGSDQAASDFQYSLGLTSRDADTALMVYGYNELPEKKISKLYIFLMLLCEPMPIMIWLAIVIEAVITKWMDMAILLAIQFCNASIAFYETTKAGDAVAALKASLKPVATVKRDGSWSHIEARLLVPGDLISLAPGTAVPADCRINHGTVDVDQAALTGESMAVSMFRGDSVKMGSTVVRGEVEATVEFTGVSTFFGKTAALLQATNESSNLQKTLMEVIIVLVVVSLTLSAVVYLHLVQITSVVEALSFTVVIVVASIPLAIEIVTTTTLALGSKELSHHGAIVTRLSAIEDMAGMAILCSDKTGTLTQNKMVIQEETPVYYPGESQYTLLRFAAMASKWKEPPKDALDTLTLNAVDLPSLEHMEQLEFFPFDPVIKRTEATLRDTRTGEVFKTSKGAPNVILKLAGHTGVVVGGVAAVERDLVALGERGIRCMAVARTNSAGAWVFLGLLTFLDPPREDTWATIDDARRYGVAVKMITGDHQLIAKETARRLNMGHKIFSAEGLPHLDPVTKQKPENLAKSYGDMVLSADGFAEVFPEHKYLIVECLREMGHKVGMTGDGVNDAPALKRADIGIAVQGSTDAARAAADIVLTEPGLSTIIHGILIARVIFVRIRNFITYRIAATLQLLLFFFIAIFAFRPIEYEPEDQDDHYWPNFFHMPVMMLMLITLLNDGTLIAIGYDNVDPPAAPTLWNLRVLFTVGTVLAVVACMSSLLLLYWSLDSWRDGSFYQLIGLGGLTYGQVTTSIFLKVAVSDFLTLFSARAGDKWFWSSRPATVLILAGGVALTCSTMAACLWPRRKPDGIPTLGLELRAPRILPVWIWFYCLVWWVIQVSPVNRCKCKLYR